MIEIYYFHPVQKNYIPMGKKTIPVILNELGSCNLTLIAKNTSQDVLGNVSLSFIPQSLETGLPSDLRYAITSETMRDIVFKTLDISTTIEAILPENHINLHIQADDNSDLNIDYTDFTLDLSFTASKFVPNDILAYYEFNEPLNSLKPIDSISSFEGTISSGSLNKPLRGLGHLFSDKFTLFTTNISNESPEISVFVKFRADHLKQLATIFNLADTSRELKIELREDDYIYVSDDTGDIAKSNSSIVTGRDYVLGLSVASNKVIFTINNTLGTIIKNIVDAPYGEPIMSSFGLAGIIDSLLVINGYKDQVFHSHILNNI